MARKKQEWQPPVPKPSRAARQAWLARGWTEEALTRALELRIPKVVVETWPTLDDVTFEQLEAVLENRARLILGTLRVHEAGWNDLNALAELWANAPEELGDWEVTVERSPNSFAQFWLQERVSLKLLEDRGVLLGCSAGSVRNVVVGEKRTTVYFATGMRLRKEARGQGYSKLLGDGLLAMQPMAAASVFYVRPQNENAIAWMKSRRLGALQAVRDDADGVPGVPVTVHHFPAGRFRGDRSGIRKARRADIRRCAALINGTHRGFDLFRPYTPEYLAGRLDGGVWVAFPNPAFEVYGWGDYHVVEQDGQVVACAGLWDRGRHIREVWRNAASGECRTIEAAALLDFGYERGMERQMARLIAFLVGLTRSLGRQYLLAPVDQLPELHKLLGRRRPGAETRGLLVTKFGGPTGADLKVTKPYTDLAYW